MLEKHINLAIVIAEIEQDALRTAQQAMTGDPQHTKYYQEAAYAPQITAVLEAIEADKQLAPAPSMALKG